jgi:gliding motility-associated-like protein
VAQPNALAITSSTVTNITCFGDNDGSITTALSGGTPFYLFNWTPNVSSAPIANALPPGAYSLTVTDQNGCTATQNWNITEPALLTSNQTVSNSTCSLANGSATATPAGGTAPYTYQWNDPALQTTNTMSNVFAGSYNIIVTDNHGCTVSNTATIIDMPGPTIDSVTSTPVLCHGGNTGTATVHLTAGLGTPPLVYNWTPSSQSTPTANGLTTGLYNVSIVDANGCSTIGSVSISQPPLYSLVVSPADTICFGDTAQIYAQATGGTPAYIYNWMGASGTGLSGTGPHMVTPTVPTIYSVQVTDANGCNVGPSTINIFVRPQLTVNATDVSVCDGLTVNISATATGGTGGPYTYSWNNGPTTQTQTVTGNITASPMNYTVTASDGCSTNATDIATVTVNPGSVGVFIGSDTVGCEPLTVTFIAVSNNGVNYTWNFGDGATGVGSPITHTFVNDGSYTVSMNVTTAAGCTTLISNTNYIVVNPVPDAQFTYNPNPGSAITPTINFNDLSQSNITNWSWNFGDVGSSTNTSSVQNPVHTYPGAGIYTTSLVVTNQFGCKDSVAHFVEIKDDFVFYAPNAFTPDGDGLNDIFLPLGVGWDIPTFEMYIFDRWGNLIFFTDDYRKGWDGTANHGTEVSQIDVYVWKVYLKDNTGLKHNYIGHVTIVK